MAAPVVTALATAVLTAVLAVPAGGAEPPKAPFGGGVGERASAIWIFPSDDGGSSRDFYFTEVYQGVNNAGPGGVAVVGFGTCSTTDPEDPDAELCRGFGYGHVLAPGEFEVDPLLDTAVLDYQDNEERHYGDVAERHRVTWKALDPVPGAAPFYGAGARGAGAEAKMFKRVAADGEVLGVTFDDAVERSAALARSGAFGANAPFARPGVEVTRHVDSDGRYHLELRRPL
ncbi:MAG: hypothetical protein ACRDY7_15820 [Acidimicrobiia bacterium]